MQETTPFVEKFRTQDHYFIYDVNTSRILCVSPAMYDIVDLYWRRSKDNIVRALSDKHSHEELEQGYRRVDELATIHKLFSPARLVRRVGIPTRREVAERLNQGIMQMCLEVTQACNLRCKYCAFSGEYPYNRRHGTRQMSFATAEAAVDFYLDKNSSSADDLAIGFYGGEPLLRFDLIRRAIDYANSAPAAQGRGIRFNLSTNATLLNDEMIQCFVRNNVALAISLDGPQQDHDRHRVFKNGAGSFNRVMQSLEKIRNAASEYYRTHILFNCVITPASDLSRMEAFFTTRPDLFPAGRLLVSGVSPGCVSFLETCEQSDTREKDLATLHQAFLDARAKMDDNKLVLRSALFQSDLVKIHKRLIRTEPREYEVVSPACFPGARKLFVSADGALHICERINNQFPVGDVFSGFDTMRIAAIMKDFGALMNAEDCLNCWAFRFCTHCYASVAGDGVFLQNVKEQTCAGIRERTRGALLDYCSTWERNPAAWKYMDDIIIK